jgi:hypothetical protein
MDVAIARVRIGYAWRDNTGVAMIRSRFDFSSSC